MPTPVAKYFVAESIKKKLWSGPVIDLGAGDHTDYYRDLFGSAKYVTLDIEQNVANCINIVDSILDLKTITFNSYGVALLLETLEHLKNPFIAFEKISQIIRPGGMFICTTVACWGQHGHPGDYWRFLPDGLALLCEHAKLKIFHQEIRGKLTSAPCGVMVAAIKE